MPEDTTPPKPATPEQPPVGTAATPETARATTPAPAPTNPDTSASGLPAPTPVLPDTGYTADGVPTFEGVREKIESRYGTAIGATELAEETSVGRTAAQQLDARHKAAEEKLAEIRASMHKAD